MIKWFEDIKEDDFMLVGGKASNLAKMYQFGLNVRNGFVVLSQAYETYMADNGVIDKMKEILSSSLDNQGKSEQIKEFFTVEGMSDDLKHQIHQAYKSIDSGRVAVRSSSTAEDLPGMSFAGQYSSYLNVTEETLLEKVIACWQSLWHVRAIDYREKHGIIEGFSHAVVVQEMVESQIAGVVFTANPMSGLRNQMVVNASWGLGEAVVSGEVNPDQYVVDRNRHEIVEEKIAEKTFKYIYSQEGIVSIDLDEDESKKASLTQDKIDVLLKACDKVEQYFGLPQDMEFAFDAKGVLYIVQSRDITTLYPIDALNQDDKLRPYMSACTVLLGIREPFTPLGFDLMSMMFPTIINVMTARKKKLLTNSFVAYAGNRIFIDMSYLLSNGLVAKQFAGAFAGNDLPLKDVMLQMLEDYGKRFRRQGIRFRLPLGFVKYGITMSKDIMKINKIPNAQRYDALIEEGDRWYNEIYKDYESADTTLERLDFVTKALVEAFKLSQKQASYCLDVNNYIKIEKVLKKHFANTYKVETLVQSLDGCVTQTMTMDLNKYAKYCVEQKIEPTYDHGKFIEIVEKYGHRANVELDFGTMRWREDPTYLMNLVKNYMTDDMYVRNLQDHENKRQQALDMIEEVTAKLVDIIGKKKALKFKTYMINYRYGVAMREYPKWDIVRFLELSRKSVQVIGDRLKAEGKLEDRNDIFFLRREEIIEGNNLKSLVDKAKESYDKEMKRKSIPRMLLNNGRTYYSASKLTPGAKTLQGAPLSAGTYEGNIKIVYDPMNHTLQEGEIMVTESTNPAWTPLFATAGALIMEYGGPMSHGGIVAREYGIPAVVGISSATDALKDGQRVRINGETGIIELL